ncbi:molybdenum cofactor guanylyltransferase [Cohnella lupini]|uniref:Probable molybdenum cofactor guanylyltransferase n=1 Tax=Cohnella lupini TaxID=1294267 RepID=A0A3D9IV22_9BACL|nr:molybdenum cofactor guanylyltransferase [Cohnella lupini]RED65581.1 molybdenum cofactor guanylyltransferase [Cohnella lupini]
MDKTAVILAGGQGRRMGGVNKALLLLNKETFIERQLRIAREWTDEIIVVSNDDDLLFRLSAVKELKLIGDSDEYVGEGPLAGLHAGLFAATRPYVWIVGCDQPMLDGKAADFLMERMTRGSFQASVPNINGRTQPLHGIYRKEAASIAGALLASGHRKLLDLLERLSCIEVEQAEFAEHGIAVAFSDDVDTPEQYDRVKSLFPDDEGVQRSKS